MTGRVAIARSESKRRQRASHQSAATVISARHAHATNGRRRHDAHKDRTPTHGHPRHPLTAPPRSPRSSVYDARGSRGRARAPCRPFGRWVSLARPPNRTCDFHRIRLSTNPCAGRRGPSCRIRPGRWDRCAPVAVSSGRHRGRVEQRHWPFRWPPPVREASPSELFPVEPGVLAAQPSDDPLPGELAQVGEGLAGTPRDGSSWSSPAAPGSADAAGRRAAGSFPAG